MQVSERDVDRALKHMARDVDIDSEALPRVWARVESATQKSAIDVPLRRRRRLSRAPLVAASVVALTAGLLLVPVITKTGVDVAAARELSNAADKLTAADPSSNGEATPALSNYTLIETHAWDLNQTSTQTSEYSVLVETRFETWVPRNWNDQWLDRRMTTGAVRFVAGDRDAAQRDGALTGAQQTEPDRLGPCQEYFTNLCDSQGSWTTPTKAWISDLPTNPEDMLDSLRAAAEGGKGPVEYAMFDIATIALRSQLLPVQSEAVLYRAIALIPGVQIKDGSVDLDGRVGTGYTVTQQGVFKELIIDPTTGVYLGERVLDGQSESDENILSYTSVYVKGVDQMGVS